MEHKERREFNYEMAQTIGRIEAKLDGLCGPEGRVTKIEKSQERQWWYSVAILPITGFMHALAKRWGI